MTTVTHDQIKRYLLEFNLPILGSGWISEAMISAIEVKDASIALSLELGFPSEKYKTLWTSGLTDFLRAKTGISHIAINLTENIISHAVQQGLTGIPNIKNMIAIGSGKGGVGKSTTTVNLALALKALGARVGILDADIYGPNQPHMLGVSKHVPEADQSAESNQKALLPILAHGIYAMSIGFLVAQTDTPMIWRGPMVSSALQQLLNDTRWPELDYLLIDLPPGTGDIQLTLAQKVPLSGAVIVTTPQDIALLDAKKAIRMFEKVRVPILGVVENMSLYTCKQCGHQEAIFGSGGAAHLAETYQVDVLGQLPLDMRIREEADQGKPTVIADPESDLAEIYRVIALKMTAQLALQAKRYMTKFPKIEIEKQ